MRSFSFYFALIAINFAAVAAPPTVVPSYGPNGTHWPSLIDTPYIYDTAATEIEVDPVWNDIKAQILALTSAQVSAGVVIRVRPGTLVGRGTSASAIKECGDLAWTKRVLVCPRDGYGTVDMTGGTYMFDVYNVCFAGFTFDSLKMDGCQGSAVAWCSYTDYVGITGKSGVTTNTELVEVVKPESHIANGDGMQINSVTGGNIDGVVLRGCYIAPNYFEEFYPGYPDTAYQPHTDSLQFYGSGGTYGNVTIEDSAFFASNNSSIQTGNIVGLTLNNCYVAAGSTSLYRYPHLSGGSTEATIYAFNGGGSQLDATGGVFIGGMALNLYLGGSPWENVSGTTANYDYGANYAPTVSGAWTVDTGLDETNSGMPPYPSPAYLASIWAAGPAPGSAPAAPSSLTASPAGATAISLTWTDNASDETGYKVERSPDNSTWTQIGTAPANATSYTDTGLAQGAQYHYRVRAYNGAGDSAYTSSASATTLDRKAIRAKDARSTIGGALLTR